MMRRFNAEMQCAMFVCGVFVFFFGFTLWSVSRAAPIQHGDDPGTYNWQHVQHDDSGSAFMSDPGAGGGPPSAGGPSLPGTPDADGPSESPPASVLMWWNEISDFFHSILQFMGF